MEPRLKERIVGAAIIVALGVWLIPWVLDGPDEAGEAPVAAEQDILPAAGSTAPIRTETVKLDPAASDSQPFEDSPTSHEPEPVAVIAPSREAASAAQTGSEPGAGRSDPGAGTGEQQPSRTAAASPGGWMVQLGAFGDVANANQLASRISTFGYSAVVSEFRSGGQTMHRVRIGGFDTENEAEAAASSLSAHGFPGRVIAPE